MESGRWWRDRPAFGCAARQLFPAPANVQHHLIALPLPEVGLGAVVLALALLEADQVDTVGTGELLGGGHEVPGDGLPTEPHATDTVAESTIRRSWPQSGAVSGARTQFRK